MIPRADHKPECPADKDGARQWDINRIDRGLIRLGYYGRSEIYSERRAEKILAACEHILDRKINSLDDVTEFELSEVASKVGGLYSKPLRWGLLFRRK